MLARRGLGVDVTRLVFGRTGFCAITTTGTGLIVEAIPTPPVVRLVLVTARGVNGLDTIGVLIVWVGVGFETVMVCWAAGLNLTIGGPP